MAYDEWSRSNKLTGRLTIAISVAIFASTFIAQSVSCRVGFLLLTSNNTVREIGLQLFPSICSHAFMFSNRFNVIKPIRSDFLQMAGIFNVIRHILIIAITVHLMASKITTSSFPKNYGALRVVKAIFDMLLLSLVVISLVCHPKA